MVPHSSAGSSRVASLARPFLPSASRAGSAVLGVMVAALLFAGAPHASPDVAQAKVTTTTSAGTTEYRVTETPRDATKLGRLTLIPDTRVRLVFEKMETNGLAGRGDAEFAVSPAPGDGGGRSSGAGELEIGEGPWKPIRRTISVQPFTCPSVAGPLGEAAPTGNVISTRVIVSSEYRSRTLIFKRGSRLLARVLRIGYLSPRDYKRLRDPNGNLTFQTVFGRRAVVDYIRILPRRGVTFAGIANGGAKRLRFRLTPGQRKTAEFDVQIDCNFDTSRSRSDGLRDVWFSLESAASTRGSGARRGIQPNIWADLAGYSRSDFRVAYAWEGAA